MRRCCTLSHICICNDLPPLFFNHDLYPACFRVSFCYDTQCLTDTAFQMIFFHASFANQVKPVECVPLIQTILHQHMNMNNEAQILFQIQIVSIVQCMIFVLSLVCFNNKKTLAMFVNEWALGIYSIIHSFIYKNTNNLIGYMENISVSFVEFCRVVFTDSSCLLTYFAAL